LLLPLLPLPLLLAFRPPRGREEIKDEENER